MRLAPDPSGGPAAPQIAASAADPDLLSASSTPHPGDPGAWVLINPRASGGRVARLLPQLMQCIASTPGAHVGCSAPDNIADALALLRQRPVASRCVLVGGDGTLHHMLPALLERGLTLGLVPLGSGNDFARALGLATLPWRDALQLALTGPARRVDIGEAVHEGRVTPFASSFTAGFDSAVGARALRGPAFLRGLPRYLWATLGELASLRNWPVRLSVDGGPPREVVALLASVLNTPSYGSGMPAVPHARIDDQRLDLLLAERFGRLATAAMLPMLLAGRHLGHPRVRTLSFSQLHAQAESPVPLAADGEDAGQACQWTVRVRTAALSVIGPVASFTPPSP